MNGIRGRKKMDKKSMDCFLTAPYLFAALRFSGKELLLVRFLADHFFTATEQHGR
jgi:hypothetical protein